MTSVSVARQASLHQFLQCDVGSQRPCASSKHGSSPTIWLTGNKEYRNGKEYDLPMVRQGRRRGRSLLRNDLSRQRGWNARAPGDYPDGKQGDVLVVEFTVAGIPCIGLNRGAMFMHNESFSFQISTENQEETDRDWNAIVGNGGRESDCGWCKDKWGVSWQITPRVLMEAMRAGGSQAKREFDAMMTMKKDRYCRDRSRRARLTGDCELVDISTNLSGGFGYLAEVFALTTRETWNGKVVLPRIGFLGKQVPARDISVIRA